MSPSLSDFIANITNQIQKLRMEHLIKNEFLVELKTYTTHIESCLTKIEENTAPSQKTKLVHEIEANAKSFVEDLFAQCKSYATDRETQLSPLNPDENWIELKQSFPPHQPVQKTAKANCDQTFFQNQVVELLQTHLNPIHAKIQMLNNQTSKDKVAKLKATRLQALVDELFDLSKKDLQRAQVRADIIKAFEKAENDPVLSLERNWLTKVAYTLLNALTAISGFGLAYRGLFCDNWFFHHKSASQALVEQTKQTFAKTLQ